MPRSLIAWNVPNLITVPLMAFLGFLIFGLAWQLTMKAVRGGTGGTSDPQTQDGL